MKSDPLFVGIDVQINRGVSVAVMDTSAGVIRSTWLTSNTAQESLVRFLEDLRPSRCIVGIDAPAMPLSALRKWTFSKSGWHRSAGKVGRHCELVIKTLGLANPQWTPLMHDAPQWMRLGFDLFESVARAGARPYEVFPTATYHTLDKSDSPDMVRMPLSGLSPGPKDMLDAVAAAYTVLRLHLGEGCEVGGGDGLGTIVLPEQVPHHPIMDWPDENMVLP